MYIPEQATHLCLLSFFMTFVFVRNIILLFWKSGENRREVNPVNHVNPSYKKGGLKQGNVNHVDLLGTLVPGGRHKKPPAPFP